MVTYAVKEWCLNNNALILGIDAAVVNDGGRGIVATRDISAEQIILSVPEALLFTTPSAERDSFFKEKRLLFQNITSHQVLICFLLSELSKGVNSQWSVYLKSLPHLYTTFYNFSLADVEELQVPYAQDLASTARDRAVDNWKQSRPFLTSLGLPAKFLSRGAWMWAEATLSSRTMYVPFDSAGALTPFGDLHNYAPPPPPFTPDVTAGLEHGVGFDSRRANKNSRATVGRNELDSPAAVATAAAVVAAEPALSTSTKERRAVAMSGEPALIAAGAEAGLTSEQASLLPTVVVAAAAATAASSSQEPALSLTSATGAAAANGVAGATGAVSTPEQPALALTAAARVTTGSTSATLLSVGATTALAAAAAAAAELYEEVLNAVTADSAQLVPLTNRSSQSSPLGTDLPDQVQSSGRNSLMEELTEKESHTAASQIGRSPTGDLDEPSEGSGNHSEVSHEETSYEKLENESAELAENAEESIAGDGYFDEATRCYHIVARRRYRAGEQVYLCYGAYTNLELLESYGFTLAANPHDKALISREILSAIILDSSSQHQRPQPATNLPQPRRPYRAQLADAQAPSKLGREAGEYGNKAVAESVSLMPVLVQVSARSTEREAQTPVGFSNEVQHTKDAVDQTSLSNSVSRPISVPSRASSGLRAAQVPVTGTKGQLTDAAVAAAVLEQQLSPVPASVQSRASSTQRAAQVLVTVKKGQPTVAAAAAVVEQQQPPIPISVQSRASNTHRAAQVPVTAKKGQLTMAVLDQELPPAAQCFVHADGHPGWALLVALRKLAEMARSRGASKHYAQEGERLSVQGDILAMQWLAAACSAQLEALPTTLEQDEALLASCTSGRNSAKEQPEGLAVSCSGTNNAKDKDTPVETRSQNPDLPTLHDLDRSSTQSCSIELNCTVESVRSRLESLEPLQAQPGTSVLESTRAGLATEEREKSDSNSEKCKQVRVTQVSNSSLMKEGVVIASNSGDATENSRDKAILPCSSLTKEGDSIPSDSDGAVESNRGKASLPCSSLTHEVNSIPSKSDEAVESGRGKTCAEGGEASDKSSAGYLSDCALEAVRWRASYKRLLILACHTSRQSCEWLERYSSNNNNKNKLP